MLDELPRRTPHALYPHTKNLRGKNLRNKACTHTDSC
ncbi:hypothetical protein HDE74_004946 [Janthinobacterium sp. K2Li3]|nr:hypothetical protein [Janthinobacterium sp. K2C7]MBB5384169.1 hypothetical protein [Janthinobacterium sp. K2Li3]MBB5389371.1 hypothetical protein [Janthinobacterium sp. K2E3]